MSMRPFLKTLLNPIRRPTVSFNRNVYIQVQDTPNPLSLKFLPGQKILDGSNSFTFNSIASARNSPLARQLFKVDGVKSVFFGEDFITITKKDEDTDWAMMRAELFSTIADFLQSGKTVVDVEGTQPEYQDTTILETDDDTVAMIKELLDSRVRPMVQEDGGDITYVGFENGVVKLKLKGSCTGCPSSSVTLKSGIQNMLQFYVPEIKEVIEVKDEEDDLVEKELKKFEQSRGITD